MQMADLKLPVGRGGKRAEPRALVAVGGSPASHPGDGGAAVGGGSTSGDGAAASVGTLQAGGDFEDASKN
jgi:hypothetical protein